MKFHEKAHAALLAVNIEYHWSHILRGRRRANQLLDSGISLNSEQMLRLNRRMMHHSLLAMRKEAYYASRFVPSHTGRTHNFKYSGKTVDNPQNT